MGGNIGAAAAGSVLGNVAASASRDAVLGFASSLTGDKNSAVTHTLANAMSNVIASSAGAVGGLVAGGGNSHASALNGAAAASALEQYNAEEHITVYAHRKKGVPITRETVQTIFGVVSALPIPIVSSIASAGLVVMDLQKGDYASATLDSLGLIPEVGSGIKEAVYGIKGLNKAVKGLETVEEARNAKRTFQEGSSFARESRAEQHEIEHEAANDNYAAANDNHAVSVEDQRLMVVNGLEGRRSNARAHSYHGEERKWVQYRQCATGTKRW